MFNRHLIFLFVISTISVPLLSMQHKLYLLARAAQKNHLAAIKKLDPAGTNPPLTAGHYIGRTPLYFAAASGNLAIVNYYVKKLERKDKDINPALTAGDDVGHTPLYVAALGGHLDIVNYYVKKLERKGKDINPALTAGDDVGHTPLFMAAQNDRRAIVNYYVKKLESQGKDSNPALTTGNYWTPLHIAAIAGHLDIVKTLICRGALLTVRTGGGSTAEDLARVHNRHDVADYLHTTADLTQRLLKDCERAEGLIALIAESHEKLFKTPKDEIRTVYDLTEAIETYRGQVQQLLLQIKQLIEQGAEVNAHGKKGYSPMHCLIGYYNPEGPTQFDEEVRALIDNGQVTLDAVADNGDTALSLAAHYGNSRIFKYLLKKGANPAIGINPLAAALQHNQIHVLRFLCGHDEQPAIYGVKRPRDADEYDRPQAKRIRVDQQPK